MRTVLFIENQHNTERHFIRGFRIGAHRAGWNSPRIWLRQPDGAVKPAETLSREIEEHSPDLIVWMMAHVMVQPGFLETEAIRHIPKASLWFDDYQRTYAIQRYPENHQRLARQCHLKTYVWDGYWRRKFEEHFAVACLPIHLAADEIELFPSDPTHFKGFEDSLIFIGNTPSLDAIFKEAAALPAACLQLVRDTRRIIEKSAYGRIPYDALDEAYQSMSPKLRAAVDRCRQDLVVHVLINRQAWLLGKREVRLRILRLAAQQRPLAILSGHSDKSFAGPDEISRDLGTCRCPVKFISTDHVSLTQLGCLYHIGGLHLQATDPQSVAGGIPLRVFETAASARPLLSDFKPELADCFQPGQEILCYQNDQDFADKLNDALKHPERFKEIGEAAHQRFLKEHTWKHRFLQIAADADEPGCDFP
ncbi:MAG: glycosyltransferase family 1 protein [Verrucomicrobia bacterium]|nr:glycosyltransferase family 1 protein [Verrucomicrobiota bacterium]